jgi:argininosuccinate lyase
MQTADIIGSKAYAKAIVHKSEVLSAHECAEILHGLDLVEREWTYHITSTSYLNI